MLAEVVKSSMLLSVCFSSLLVIDVLVPGYLAFKIKGNQTELLNVIKEFKSKYGHLQEIFQSLTINYEELGKKLEILNKKSEDLKEKSKQINEKIALYKSLILKISSSNESWASEAKSILLNYLTYSLNLVLKTRRNDQSDFACFIIDIGVDFFNFRTGIFKDAPLHTAASNSKLSVVKMLLEKGAFVDVKNKNRNTPLHLAVKTGHLDVVNYLIKHGANVNSKSLNGLTPLMIASDRQYIFIVKTLINHGADLDMKDDNGKTAVFWASNFKQNIDIVNELVNSGANNDTFSKNFGIHEPLSYMTMEKQEISTLSCLNGFVYIAEIDGCVDASDTYWEDYMN